MLKVGVFTHYHLTTPGYKTKKSKFGQTVEFCPNCGKMSYDGVEYNRFILSVAYTIPAIYKLKQKNEKEIKGIRWEII